MDVGAIIGGAMNLVGDVVGGALNFAGIKRQIEGSKELQAAEHDQQRYLLWFSLANENRALQNNLFEKDNTLTYLLIAVVVIVVIVIAFRALRS